MSRTRYTRVRDGASVSETEACEANGAVRDGYSIHVPSVLRDGQYARFDMMFMDSAGAPVSLNDAERTFADSAEGRHSIALAKAQFDMGQAYKREGERTPWNDGMATSAVRAEMSRRGALASMVADAQARLPILQAEAATARQKMIDDMNGWRRGGGR